MGQYLRWDKAIERDIKLEAEGKLPIKMEPFTMPYLSWLNKIGRIFYVNGERDNIVAINPNKNIREWAWVITEYCFDHNIDVGYRGDAWTLVYKLMIEAIFNEKTRLSK